MALLCRVLGVSRAGYYQSRNVPLSARRQKRDAVAREARRFHARSHGVYGYRKVAEDIRQETGLRCSKETVRRVMREERLCAKARHKFVVTTQSKHLARLAQRHRWYAFAPITE